MRLRYRLLLIRHGQAHSNKRGAFLGRQDDPLTEKGRSQILSLGERMVGEEPDAIWCSPLKRAHDSARLLAQKFELEPTLEPALMEQDYGAWDGHTFMETAKQFPGDFDAWKTGNTRLGPTDGETLEQVSSRMMACHRKLEETVRDGATYIWVGHAGAFATLLCGILKVPLCNQWPFMLPAGTLTELQFLDFGPRLMRLGWE